MQVLTYIYYIIYTYLYNYNIFAWHIFLRVNSFIVRKDVEKGPEYRAPRLEEQVLQNTCLIVDVVSYQNM